MGITDEFMQSQNKDYVLHIQVSPVSIEVKFLEVPLTSPRTPLVDV